MASFTNFCARASGSNLNAGTRTGDTTVPGTSASLTYASGTWANATRVFTVASGNPSSDGVAVDDYAAIDTGGSAAVMIGRVSARTSTTITISSTFYGTNPANGTYTLRIGGAWAGPSAGSSFPFGLSTMTNLANSAGNRVRVNLMNDQTYSMTSSLTVGSNNAHYLQGFSSSYGDGGRATVDGGTSGSSYALLTVGAGSNPMVIADLIFSDNGATGIADGTSVAVSVLFLRCVFRNMRGVGMSTSSTGAAVCVECEAYANNESNTAAYGGFWLAQGLCLNCISHDNTGSNSSGFVFNPASPGSVHCVGCIADTNGGHGFRMSSSSYPCTAIQCDAYNNGGDGYFGNGAPNLLYNCNTVKNTGAGVSNSSTLGPTYCFNCGFGAGTQANGSTTSGQVVEVGSVTYPANQTPWADPANGDFRIILAQAIGAGRGQFTQVASSYAGALGYPDIGACLAAASLTAGGKRAGHGGGRAG